MGFAEFFRRRASRDEKKLPELIDISAPDFFQDPYPLYASLRRQRPLAALTSGGYLLTRHEDIVTALRHPHLGNAPSRFATLSPRNRNKYVAASVAGNILPFLDRPEHALARHVVFRSVHAHFQRFAPILPEIAEQIIGKRTASRIELISQIASPFALRVMSDFLGISGEDASQLKAFTKSFFHLFAPIRDTISLERVNDDLAMFRNLLGPYVDERRTAPREDLLSELVTGELKGERLSTEQVIDNAILVFADGVENVEAGIANVLLIMETYPVARAAFESGAVLVQDIVQEALRLDSPAQLIPRIAHANVDLHETTIPADTPIFLALASANRDPTVFEEPDQFRLDRDKSHLLTFGRGRHSCIGSHLSLAQISAVVDALIRRRVKLLTTRQSIAYHHRFGHRWPVAMEVQI